MIAFLLGVFVGFAVVVAIGYIAIASIESIDPPDHTGER